MYSMWNKVSYVVFGLVAVFSMPATASEVVELAAKQASLETGIDEELLLAIATVESGRNAQKIGKLGEVGAWQLRPEFHAVKRNNEINNARVAARYLLQLRKQCASYGKAYFVCFNVGGHRKVKLKDPVNFVYYKKVMAAKRANARMVAGE